MKSENKCVFGGKNDVAEAHLTVPSNKAVGGGSKSCPIWLNLFLCVQLILEMNWFNEELDRKKTSENETP